MSKKKDIPTTAKIIQGILMGLCAMVLIGAIGGSLGLHEKGGIATTVYAIVFAVVPVAVGIKSSGWKPNSTNVNSANSSSASFSGKAPSRDYILVQKTMVIHRKSCRYAQNLYSENFTYTDSKNAAISAGYRPCKHCKP